MKIVIVSAVFPPEPVVSAQTSSQLAEELTWSGHQVTVLAPFPSRPNGRLFEGYHRSLYREEFPSYRLIRCFSFLSASSTMLSRLFENISFAVSSSLRLLLLPRPDVIYINSWAIFGVGFISAVAYLRRIPVAISVQDVYPESLAEQGRVRRQSKLFRILRWLDAQTARSAGAVVVLSHHLRESYGQDRGLLADRIHVVGNWGEADSVPVDGDSARGMRRRMRIPDNETLVVYGGNIGAAAGLEAVIGAFEQIGKGEKLRLMIAGSGARLRACRELVAQKRMEDRVFFYSPWPREETGTVLGAADVLLLPTQGGQSLVSVPSKLISYMLSGKPVLAIVLENSETARVIASAEAGWTIPPGNGGNLVAALRAIAATRAGERQLIGEHAKQYALRHLTRDANLPKLVDLLLRLATPKSGSALHQPATETQ